MPVWTDAQLGTALGYAIAALVLLFPVVVARWLVTTRWFAERRRLRWAGERVAPQPLRDPMDELGQLGEDPRGRPRRRRG
jgi:hypothetical protein